MYYILLQLEGTDDIAKGEVWSTSFAAGFWKKFPHDSLEKFCDRQKVEIIGEVKSYKQLSILMNKFHNIDDMRQFFKPK